MDPKDRQLSPPESKRLRLSTFERHFLNDKTKDVTFEVRGHSIPAHKVVLSSTSDLLQRMLYDPPRDRIVDNECSPEVFKSLLKIVYFREIPEDLSLPLLLEVHALSRRLQMASVEAMALERFQKSLSSENFVLISEKISQDSHLWSTLKTFAQHNPKTIADLMPEALRRPFETFARLVRLVEPPQSQLIDLIHGHLSSGQEVADRRRLASLVCLDTCSSRDLLRLQKMEVFETKTLDTLLERKLEENERKIKESEERSLEGQKREQAMAKNCEQFAQKYNELMANYREAKEVLGPLVEGSQEKVKVNQFIYQKSNCYLGKNQKKFSFRF